MVVLFYYYYFSFFSFLPAFIAGWSRNFGTDDADKTLIYYWFKVYN